MRKVLFGIAITLSILWIYQTYERYNEQAQFLKENKALLQQEIKNARKLVVTEGHFSQVFNYQQSEKIFANLLTTEKKALVIANANVTIAYDLSKINFKIDDTNKTLYITNIPKPEVKIFPDLKYYDVSGDYLNPFDADDFNKIKTEIDNSFRKKVEASNLEENAENRLITELSRFYILTNAMGWKLVYNQNIIKQTNDFKDLKNKS